MMDWYLEDRTRLKGRPKRTIADYVESNVFLVPRRFDSLHEARSSGLPIFVRSEHPLEYSDISGFFDSFSLSFFEDKAGEEVTSLEQLKEIMLKKLESNEDSVFFGNRLYNIYCKLLGLPLDNGLSYSLWEELGGFNRTMIADSSIQGRYHVHERFVDTNPKSENSWGYNYMVIENSRPTLNMSQSRNVPKTKDFEKMIEFYEGIRKLSKFEQKNCPLIEFQFVNGQYYFLQYHRGRDFNPSPFKLDRPPQKDETEVLFVRGHTAPEGYTGSVVVYYRDYCGKHFDEWKIPEREFGSFDFHTNYIFSQIMFPRRTLQIVYPSYKQNLQWELFKYATHHNQTSELFIPEISIVSDRSLFMEPKEKETFSFDEFKEEEINQFYLRARELQKDSTIDVKIVSDGRRAYIERLT